MLTKPLTLQESLEEISTKLMLEITFIRLVSKWLRKYIFIIIGNGKVFLTFPCETFLDHIISSCSIYI